MEEPSAGAPNGEPPPSGSGSPAPGSALDSHLIGRLPCVFCGYDLQGLSIRGQCPECGSAVRATILHRVDPRAEEFAPILGRRRVAMGLVMWPLGGLIIALSSWVERLLELARSEWGMAISVPGLDVVAMVGVVLVGLGGLAMLKPTRESPIGRCLVALLGVSAVVPLAWGVWRTGAIDRAGWQAYSGEVDPDRAVARLVVGVSVVVMCLGLRPIGREMVRRSMALRTGRVDRQAILLVAIAATVAMVGDGLRLASALDTGWSIAGTIGTPVVAIGSMLVTVGIVGGLIDAMRIARAVLQPLPSLEDVVGSPRA